jgi:hypothetical protein
MPSLPPVSAKVIADAEQFINEFKRAENAARRSASNIDREITDLAKKTAKKFELGDVGKDILKGSGLFGGFAIAQTASELISGHFKEAAESAEKLAAYSERSLKAVQEAIKAGRTDAQQLAALKAEQARQQREVDNFWNERQAQANRSGRKVDPSKISQEQTDRLEGIKAEMQERETLIRSLEKKEADRATTEAVKAIENDQQRRLKALAEGLQQQEKAFDTLIETQRKANDETAKTREEAAKLAEKYRELADPALVFTKQMREAEAAAADGKITFAEAARAVEALKDAMRRDERARVDRALADFFGDIDERTKELNRAKDGARELGLVFNSAFEDAVVNGEKLGDVLRSLEKDLLRIALRRNVTEPLFDMLSAGVGGGLGKLFGFATGGDFTVGGQGGTDSQLVAFRATPGEQVSVRTPAQQAGGSSPSIVVHQTNSFQTGVTRQELAGLMPQMIESAKRAVLDAVSRGGGYRKAFA